MTVTSLTIEKVRDGGYVVTFTNEERGFCRAPVYAATEITDALEYIKRNLGNNSAQMR